MGKSLYIQRMKEELMSEGVHKDTCNVVVPVHGPKVTFDTMVESLKGAYKGDINSAIIFHIDISPSVSYFIL